MLRTIAQHYHFNIIRVYPTWDYYNRAPDKFVFDEIEEVMKYCDEFGLKVLMGIVMETAPYWLEQAHPEARFVDAKGQPQRLEGSSAQITGGWPGLCLDWEPVREAASRFIRELAKVVASHPSMYAYDCWNEPHIEPAWQRNIWASPQERLYCYCKQTIAEFHQWLERRYQTIERLERGVDAAVSQLRGHRSAPSDGDLRRLGGLAALHHGPKHQVHALPGGYGSFG